ncbi:MAG: hypothetical protein A2Z03_07855 [Chloroflexi bacterium RBG_16_56_8]|nr:MAG: hypothetical protein A2Z03_07855 [Chloroflexi bacterium RBG_16_56_8]
MNNRTVGIIATVLSALACGCAAIFAVVWGLLIATNTPITLTSGGQQSVETFPPTIGYVLLCLSLLLILVPVGIGFFTLRKKPSGPVNNEPIPPAT